MGTVFIIRYNFLITSRTATRHFETDITTQDCTIWASRQHKRDITMSRRAETLKGGAGRKKTHIYVVTALNRRGVGLRSAQNVHEMVAGALWRLYPWWANTRTHTQIRTTANKILPLHIALAHNANSKYTIINRQL